MQKFPLMRGMLESLLISILSILTVSCAPIEPQFYPMPDSDIRISESKSADKVDLYITKKPEYKYEEMGMVTLETYGSKGDEPQIYQRLRKKAGELGANGLIIMNSQTSVETRPNITYDYWGYPIDGETAYSVIKYRGMAIRKK